MASNDDDILKKVIFNYETSNYDEENRVLKLSVEHLRGELDKFKASPLMVCEVVDIIEKNAVIRIPNGNQFFVNVSAECEKLIPGDTVLVEQKNLMVVRKLSVSKNYDVEKFVIVEKPNVSYSEIGGLDGQIEEIQEVVELPLKNPEIFKKVGIQPPKGILLHGPPGTGKTLLAKAVATSTQSTFIEIVGSELVQKFIGEGAKLVKEIFELARAKQPSIIFIDEIDAIASRRIEIGTSGEREVQRTFMQLLAEIDGFKHLGKVKIVGCTNRIDILDPAILRPGRLDRLIKIELPDEKSRLTIFKIHTKRMTLNKDINIQKVIRGMEGFSGAEIKAVCTESGYFAIRENRTMVYENDFLKATNKVRQDLESESNEYRHMFG